jgi:Domain of unknown function (DUF4307)
VSNHRAADPKLRERYGIKDSRFPKLSGWLGYAILFGVIGIGWLLWSANHYARPEIRSTLISFDVIDSKGINIRYSVSVRDSKASHSCQLIARDFGANIVGEITQNFPVGTSKLTQITRIPTRALAVNADITACRKI